MKLLLTGLTILTSCLIVQAQQKYTLSGYTTDQENGEALIGTTILIHPVEKGVTSNVYGFYSITLPEGEYTIEYRYIGFKTIAKQLLLSQNTRLDIELNALEQTLDEIVVTDKVVDENVSSMQMSTNALEMKAIERIPAFAGEVDVLKGIQMLPGVSTVGEGASGFNIRGGGVGQNLVLLDEAPVYQSSHLFGFFSVFNPDAVKDVKLYKGGIPSQYGGRISSILDIRMKEGNNKEVDVSGGIGTVFSRLAVEGPIKKGKSSFIIAGRRSYADVLAKAFTDVLKDGAGLYFYDVTAKTNFTINDKNNVYVSGYVGRDVFKFDQYQGFDWGNTTATIRWNHLHGNKLFSNYTAFYSNYDYGFTFGENEADLFDWKSKINTFNFKPEYTLFLNANNNLSFGGEVILYQFEPAKTKITSGGVTTINDLEKRKALEASVYIGNEHTLTKSLSMQYGLRYSFFNYLGGTVYHYGETVPGTKKPLLSTEKKDNWESIQKYGNLEPRFSMRYQLNKTASIKASYNRMAQYIHLISNTTASLPIDVWQPSTNNIAPLIGDQVGLGYFKNFKKNTFETSAEVYYKWTQNQVEYIDGADIFINKYLESQLLVGKGRSYGLEMYAKKNGGRLNGWISYTLAKSELQVDGINYTNSPIEKKGEWYPTRFDQRHNIKVSAFYDLKPKTQLSANFTYISGTPTTYPTDRITVQDYVIPYISKSERNNFRIPDYHRLDLSITFKNIWRGKKQRSGEDNLVVSLYNVYNRQNPFSVYFSQGTDRQPKDTPVSTYATQLSIIGSVIPAISYNFKF